MDRARAGWGGSYCIGIRNLDQNMFAVVYLYHESHPGRIPDVIFKVDVRSIKYMSTHRKVPRPDKGWYGSEESSFYRV